MLVKDGHYLVDNVLVGNSSKEPKLKKSLFKIIVKPH